jgi:hypothetical protein
MNELLYQITQTFLIPLSILFAGLCVSGNSGLRAFISVVGLLVSIAFFLCVKDVPTALEDAATIGLLSAGLGVAWILALLWQTFGWIRRNRSKNEVGPNP